MSELKIGRVGELKENFLVLGDEEMTVSVEPQLMRITIAHSPLVLALFEHIECFPDVACSWR